MPHEFEFSRTHWAVKDVDLYRVLLRNFQPRRQRPSVFTIPEHEKIESVLVSAMMPFDAGFTAVYDSIKAAAEKVASPERSIGMNDGLRAGRACSAAPGPLPR